MPEEQSHSALPSEALKLARRLGATECQQGFVELRQSGLLRAGPGRHWLRFSAHQMISLIQCSFSWKARVGPFGALRVRDELLDGQPFGSVSLAGLVPLARAERSPELLKGELLRYLAELPWAPDAILSNPYLNWSVPEVGKLTVSARIKEVFAQVCFSLDANGLVSRVDAFDRPRQEGNTFKERPWHGIFANYCQVAGRTIPFSAQVGWTVDDDDVSVWRGHLDHWQIRPIQR